MDDADCVRALGVVVPVAAEGAGDEHRAVVEVPVLADGVDTSLGQTRGLLVIVRCGCSFPKVLLSVLRISKV